MAEIGVFEAMYTMRAMRRLKPDPVPADIIRKVIEAGTMAPNGQNSQPWAFVVVREKEAKNFIQQRYHRAMTSRFGAMAPKDSDKSAMAKTYRAAMYLSEHLAEVPVLLLACGKRDWPFNIPPERRVGLAPPSYGSIYPAVENILLSCRALGLGACLTTAHILYEQELHERFDIPKDYGIVVMVPIGYPQGRFGPIERRPVEEVMHFDRWDNQKPPQN